jgi:O-antigen/teichoic acid export membrane protein
VLDRNDGQATSLVRWLALPVALGMASTYLNGVLNGFRAIGVLALLQILGAAALALLVYPASRLVKGDHPIAFIAKLSAPPAVGLALGTRSPTAFTIMIEPTSGSRSARRRHERPWS